MYLFMFCANGGVISEACEAFHSMGVVSERGLGAGAYCGVTFVR